MNEPWLVRFEGGEPSHTLSDGKKLMRHAIRIIRVDGEVEDLQKAIDTATVLCSLHHPDFVIHPTAVVDYKRLVRGASWRHAVLRKDGDGDE